jgi:hypothetical protein
VSTTTIDPAIAAYVERCAVYLRDLSEPLQDQLREDIEQIVAEVVAELGGRPEELMGPPLRFVTELRTAAGLLPPPAAADAPAVSTTFADRVAAIRRHPSVRWVRTLAPELRPAWWVARGILVAIALGMLTGARRPFWIAGLVPIWPVLGSRLLGLAAAGAGVYLSVEAQRRVLTRRQRILRAVATGVAVLSALASVAAIRGWDEGRAYAYPYAYTPPPAPQPFKPFTMVQIGSDLTGETIAVSSLGEARAAVAKLRSGAPPTSISVTSGGTKTYPGTEVDIDRALVELVSQGYLAPAP